MKKMMIIAVMIGALLMPAQVSAQNGKEKRGDKKVQVDNRKGYNREGRSGVKNNMYRKKGNNKPVVVHKHHSAPPVVVHKHHSAPPVVVHEHCNSDVAVGAAVVIGAAALISLLAN